MENNLILVVKPFLIGRTSSSTVALSDTATFNLLPLPMSVQFQSCMFSFSLYFDSFRRPPV